MGATTECRHEGNLSTKIQYFSEGKHRVTKAAGKAEKCPFNLDAPRRLSRRTRIRPYFLSLSRFCLRNLETLGATTAMQ